MKKALLLLACGLLAAASASARWRSLRGDAVLLFYPAGREDRAEALLAALEAHRGGVEELVGRRVRRPVLVLEDYGALANGYADPVFGSVHAGLSPPVAGPLSAGRDWYALVGTHEYAHLLQLTAGGGFPGLLASLFGNHLNPNLFVPLFWVEGVAVYAESSFDPVSGRLNEGAYDALLAARVREERFPTLTEAAFRPAAYPGDEGPYLFGGEFVRYLVRTYGPDSPARIIAGTGSSALAYFSPLLPALGVDRQARRVCGLSLPRLWQQWRAYEEGRLAGHIQAGERIGGPAWHANWPLAAGGSLYYSRSLQVKSGPYRVRWRHELVEYDPAAGNERILVSSTAPFACPFRVAGGTLYYALAELEPGYANTWLEGYGYSTRLYALDLAGGRRRLLLRGPLTAFAVTGPGRILYAREREDAFGSELWSWEAGRAERLTVSDYQIGEMLAGEELYLSARREGENFSVYALSRRALAEAVPEPESLARPLVTSEYREFGLGLAGRGLLFSAGYTGRLECYLLDTQSGRLSLLPGGTAGAAALEDGTLYFVGAGAGGTGIYRRPLRLEEARPQQAAAFPPPPVPDPAPDPGDYRRGGYLPNLGTLRPRVLVPVLAGAIGDGVEVYRAGAEVMGRSALGDIAYTLAGVYGSGDEALEVDLELSALVAPRLRFSLALSTAGGNALEAFLETPLYRSLGPGPSFLTLGLGTRFPEEDFSRLQLFCAAGAGRLAPRTAFAARLESALEHRGLGSDRDLRGLQGRLEASCLLGGAEPAVRLLGAWAEEGGAWELPAIRGYTEEAQVELGGQASLELSLPLVRIRRGLWNPSLYAEDLFLVPFFDLSFSADGPGGYAGGAELHQEIKLFNMLGGLPLDAYAGAALNRDGAWSFYFGLKSPLLPLSVTGAAPDPRPARLAPDAS